MLFPRQESDSAFYSTTDDSNDNDYYDDNFWYTPKGYTVKYAIFGSILFLFFLWFVLGSIHARKRMQKGLPPLAYHRWLVSRSMRARFQAPPQNHFTFYQNPNGYPYPPPQPNAYYPMSPYTEAPPPVYNGNDVPPTYQPPAHGPPPGASKVAPQQYAPPPGSPYAGGAYMPPSGSYMLPPGPPPPAEHAGEEQANGGVSGAPAPPQQAHHTGSSNPYRM
ncbi:hypothetical protein K490DRAFT_64788 [Saccharata proteae CBS 121410]|uniref:Uncharacterized protein n=1 Tax=Saccharata proteae CBS 121410 TaxID=1314787 RepID=A0A9P4HXZ1_9PEZI|nr:hypothetical protein K490DRAFT_64788 [Saccharata proteae CBS 121410]